MTLTRLTGALGRRYGEDSGSNILVSLLIPFAAYLAAEHVGASGVLAAASAGITMSFGTGAKRNLVSTRLRSGACWDMIQFTLNSVVFVLLGQQMPTILESVGTITPNSGARTAWQLGGYVIAIVLVLFAARFA